jgi:hypothetical protein
LPAPHTKTFPFSSIAPEFIELHAIFLNIFINKCFQ